MASDLSNKKILLGLTGGIAIYKCVELVRRLKAQNYDVRVVMTEGAKAFITPLTFQTISGHRVRDSVFDPSAEENIGHIELAKWADLILIAPCTANFIAQMTHGFANDILSTLILATNKPLFIAPAMNQQMYANQAVQANLSVLKKRGVHILGPDYGVQACGDTGAGRMLEPEHLQNDINLFFQRAQTSPSQLQNKTILISAGGTKERIDPVRYITNKSSGKMGFSLANIACELGANVTLVYGNIEQNLLNELHPKCESISVNSALDMHATMLELATRADIVIGCAAVADYRPKHQADHKIKKEHGDDEIQITMVKNPDIISDIGHLQNNRPFTVGFAAETQNLAQYAQAKLTKKNLDLICANDVSSEQYGFNSSKNKLELFWANGHKHLELNEKDVISNEILHVIEQLYIKKRNK